MEDVNHVMRKRALWIVKCAQEKTFRPWRRALDTSGMHPVTARTRNTWCLQWMAERKSLVALSLWAHVFWHIAEARWHHSQEWMFFSTSHAQKLPHRAGKQDSENPTFDTQEWGGYPLYQRHSTGAEDFKPLYTLHHKTGQGQRKPSTLRKQNTRHKGYSGGKAMFGVKRSSLHQLNKPFQASATLRSWCK